jgi:hypothetical protein
LSLLKSIRAEAKILVKTLSVSTTCYYSGVAAADYDDGAVAREEGAVDGSLSTETIRGLPQFLGMTHDS